MAEGAKNFNKSIKTGNISTHKLSIKILYNFFQIEESLNELQHSIHPTYTNKIMSIIQNHKDTISKAQEEL